MQVIDGGCGFVCVVNERRGSGRISQLSCSLLLHAILTYFSSEE